MDSYMEREVPTSIEENHDDVNEVDILGFTNDDIKFQVHNIEDIVRNVERHGDNDQYSNDELAKYKKMIEYSKKSFYHGCPTQYMRLFATVKLFQMKVGNRWSDGSFKDLLTLLKDMLSQGSAVPEAIYEANQIICQLNLEVEKIHACKNGCILYHGAEHEYHEKCPIYGLGQFNHRKDGGIDENCKTRKGGPTKVFWYFPIIPRLKRWFTNKESELL
jgi:hypothetical protein